MSPFFLPTMYVTACLYTTHRSIVSGCGLRASFGTSSHNPQMFRPSERGAPGAPKDNAAEFRGPYPHSQNMYKAFTQVGNELCTCRGVVYKSTLSMKHVIK